MMWVYEALRGVETIERTSTTADVSGVQYDSRKVKPGDVFVAMAGGTTDGNHYIRQAVECGARAVVTDSRASYSGRGSFAGVPFYLVASGRRALAGIAANLLGHPEQALKVSGVTGTNGKTTTAFLLEQMLQRVGRKCVLIGTIETHVGDEVRSSEHTTPEASDLLRVFADGVAAGCTEAVMEISSHALDQERVWGVYVDVALFTNLTQDHLDYHGTMEAYGAAKARLFAGVGAAPPRVSIVNADDTFGAQLAGQLRHSNVLTYGIEAGEYRAEDIVLHAGRTSFTMRTPDGAIAMESPLTGRVNVYNLLAASCAGMARGLTQEQAAEAAQHLAEVPGRFQVVNGSSGAGFTVVVDYAHTDDALRNLIRLARDLVGSGKVITIFGCGGDRDRTKRPKMGRAAGEGSDLVIVTSDNPRSEDPASIIEEILVGLGATGTGFLVEADRASAIQRGIAEARPGDIVLIAGKGHEKVQIFASGVAKFDDAEVAAEALLPVVRRVKP